MSICKPWIAFRGITDPTSSQIERIADGSCKRRWMGGQLVPTGPCFSRRQGPSALYIWPSAGKYNRDTSVSFLQADNGISQKAGWSPLLP